jgi:hypothetical protein
MLTRKRNFPPRMTRGGRLTAAGHRDFGAGRTENIFVCPTPRQSLSPGSERTDELATLRNGGPEVDDQTERAARWPPAGPP